MTERGHDGASCDSSVGELEAWIELARQGDREALGRALSSVRDYLLLVANEESEPALKAKGNASDFVQETFLRAQRSVHAFRGRTASQWRHWLRKILIRSIDQERRRFVATAKRQVQREVAAAGEILAGAGAHVETPSRDMSLRELEQALIAGLERLPEHYREVVVWHQREQLSFEQIGQRCGISAEAARKRWARALHCLRKELGPAHDPQPRH